MKSLSLFLVPLMLANPVLAAAEGLNLSTDDVEAINIRISDETVEEGQLPQKSETVCYDENWVKLECTLPKSECDRPKDECLDPRVKHVTYSDVVTVTAPLPKAAPAPKPAPAPAPKPAPVAQVVAPPPAAPAQPRNIAISAIGGINFVAAAYSNSSYNPVGDSDLHNPIGGIRLAVERLNLDLMINGTPNGVGWDVRGSWLPKAMSFDRNGVRPVVGFGQRPTDPGTFGPATFVDLGGEGFWRGDSMGFSLGATLHRQLNMPAPGTVPQWDNRTPNLTKPYAPSANSVRFTALIELKLRGKFHDND